MKNYITLLVLDRIYIKLDGNEYIFNYDDIFLDIDDGLVELNVGNNIDIYIILGFEIVGIKKEIDKSILNRINNVLNGSYKVKKIFSIYEVLDKKVYILMKDFSIKYDQRIEKINFTIDDYEEEQDFSGYCVIKGYEELKEKVFQKELTSIQKLNFFCYIGYILYFLIFIIVLIVCFHFLKKYDTSEIIKEIIFKEEKIEEKEKLQQVDNQKEFIAKMKKPFKKPFYMDIDFFLNSRMYGVEYTELEYINNRWKISGEIENIEKLEQFEKSLKKHFFKYVALEFKDKNEKISFIYELSDEKV